jgi:predicted CXXCH cytochrome family protein
MCKGNCLLIFLTVLFAIPLNSSNTYSEEQILEKNAVTCLSLKCHAGTGNEKSVHDSAFEDKCKVCHGESKEHVKAPRNNSFGKVEIKLSEICLSCHDNFKFKKFIHKPLLQGDCTACHNPHDSLKKYQLIAEGTALCFQCHDSSINENEYVHGPSAMGGCLLCHDPHSADYRANLRADGSNLCILCHKDKNKQSMFKHEPAAEDCTHCHFPHSGPRKFMLKNSVPEICYACHKDKKKMIDAAPIQHAAVTNGRKCLNCHSPHMSDISKILLKPPLALCISCHDKQVKTPYGATLTNMKQLLSTNNDHHGPIKQSDCSGCHNPHGSKYFRILHSPYPRTFYAPFEIGHYSLCFNCHEKRLVLDEKTSTLTNFRNGNINLHYKHVNKKRKGRTCRACHETHASNYPKHIRRYVPFGKEAYPIKFTKTYSGGSCKSGCHTLKSYNRIREEPNR